MEAYILEICYLIASILFIVGLKMLGHPETARKGNILAGIGMVAAIFATIFLYKTNTGTDEAPVLVSLGNYPWIFGAILIGTIVGYLIAIKVPMTAMPQMVSLFNGMGGACAAVIGIIEFPHYINGSHGYLMLTTVLLGMAIGSVSFSGSMVAFAKLNGNMNKDIRLPMYNIINMLLVLTIFILIALIGLGWLNYGVFVYLLLIACLAYGVMFVIPIGGADMPVVISLLNSFTGMAAAFGGFMYGNMPMIIGGILVGSAGTILTIIMCKGMNRSLFNVVFGAFGASATGGGASGDGSQKSYKEANVSDIAVLLNYSSKLIIVPGYGLAVAQAQHKVHELEALLTERGVEVLYAIHPVAGRMPGHMNVLLAESNVEYDKLVEMDDVNPEFATTDVVLILGANDVVNPAAKTDPTSPIYGMPILDVEDAKNVIMNKRSMSVGYAGIDNELFYKPCCTMLFGDAKKVLTELVNELKAM